MAAINALPELINNYNVYNSGNKLIGVTGQVKLPSHESSFETVNGAGMLGAYEAPNPGDFGSTKIEIPFGMLDISITDPLSQRNYELILRSSAQSCDISAGTTLYRSLKFVFFGIPISFDSGTVEKGKAMGSILRMEILREIITLDEEELFMFDKLNFIYRVRGKDMLADIRKNI